MVKTKICTKCKKRKPASDFHKQNDRPSGLRCWCKKCAKLQEHKYRHSERGQKVEKEKYRRKKERPDAKEYFKNQWLKVAYRITLPKHKEIYLKQNGCCAICERPIPYDDIYTDHSHKTGKVRGLLCPICNAFAGYVEKWPELLNKILKYVGE